MSEWIEHVKNYAKMHNVSYKEALKLAKASYKPQAGGSLKTVARKAKNTNKRAYKVANKASNALDKYGHILQHYNEDLYDKLDKANTTYKDFDTKLNGGKFNAKTAVRKVKNTTKRISKEVDRLAPLVSLVNPEVGTTLMSVNEGYKRVAGGKLSGRANKYLGGSFAVPQRGGSFMVPQKGGALVSTNSTYINPSHPSFRPTNKQF